MDAFETVVGTILEREGFWVRTAFKIEITKEEKRRIERPSSPRWELDVVGYRPADNVLRVVECKSYLDSRGVSMDAFSVGKKFAGRFKLFNEDTTRTVVLERLVTQLLAGKLIRPKPTVELCLAAGKIVDRDVDEIELLFKQKGWRLFGPKWLEEQLSFIASEGYENAVAAVTAKLILRGRHK